MVEKIPLEEQISVFLNWAKYGYPIYSDKEYYPRYLKYEVGISSPIAFHKKMISQGYLTKPNIDQVLHKLKIPELKQILETNNLSKNGNKPLLIERIRINISETLLSKVTASYNGYVLSEKGTTFINDNRKYTELHKHINWQISLNEYNCMEKLLKFKTSFNDVAWGIFNKRNIEYFNSKQWGLLRNNKLYMAELLSSENKKDMELYKLIEVFYYDLTGLNNENYIDSYDMIMIAPGIIKSILSLKSLYNKSMVERCYLENPTPSLYFDKDAFALILNDLFSNGDIDITKYKKYSKK